MSETQTTIIEINGVKLEVDLRNAKRIDHLQVGSRVKCLVKKYADHATYPGVIVGFEPFANLPTIIVAYLESDYSGTGLKFQSFNSQTKDFEVVADLDNNCLEVNKANIIASMTREIEKKMLELDEVIQKKAFFEAKFKAYFVTMTGEPA